MLYHTFMKMLLRMQMEIIFSRSTFLSRHCFMAYHMMTLMILLTQFEVSILPLITIVFPLMVMISSVLAKTYMRVIVVCDIISILFRVQRFLVLYHAGSHLKFLVSVIMNVLGRMLRQWNLTRYLLSAVMYQINSALFIHIHVLNHVLSHKLNKTLIWMNVFQDMFGVMLVKVLDTSSKKRVLTILFRKNHNL